MGRRKYFKNEEMDQTSGNMGEDAQMSGIPAKKWHERISLAKRVQDDWARESGANRFHDEYKGKFDSVFFTTRFKKIPVPPVNEVFAYVQTDIAYTCSRNPYLAVNATSGTVKAARLWEVTVNYHWRHLKTKQESELEIIDKDLAGMAWHKVGNTMYSEGSGEALRIHDKGLYSRRVDWRNLFW